MCKILRYVLLDSISPLSLVIKVISNHS